MCGIVGNVIGVRVAVGPAPFCASTNVRVDAIMMKMTADAAAIERLQIIEVDNYCIVIPPSGCRIEPV